MKTQLSFVTKRTSGSRPRALVGQWACQEPINRPRQAHLCLSPNSTQLSTDLGHQAARALPYFPADATWKWDSRLARLGPTHCRRLPLLLLPIEGSALQYS